MVEDTNPNDADKIISQLDDKNIGMFFAVYWPKPCTYYWGQLQKVFSYDAESDPTKVEMRFPHMKETCADPDRITWTWPINEDMSP